MEKTTGETVVDYEEEQVHLITALFGESYLKPHRDSPRAQEWVEKHLGSKTSVLYGPELRDIHVLWKVSDEQLRAAKLAHLSEPDTEFQYFIQVSKMQVREVLLQ